MAALGFLTVVGVGLGAVTLMPKTRDVARLVVEDATRLDDLAKSRTRAREHRPRSGRVTTSASVNRAVWRRALALAGGDPSRIEVVSPTDVRVH